MTLSAKADFRLDLRKERGILSFFKYNKLGNLMGEQTPERKDVDKQSRWNVEAMYSDWAEWDKDFLKNARASASPRWPEFSEGMVSLADPKELKKLLDSLMQVDSNLSTLYTYAHLRHDEDVSEEVSKKAFSSIVSICHIFNEETSWMDPALLQLPKETLDALLSAGELKEYRVFLEKVIRLKPYTLPAREEKILAGVSKALQTSQRAFGSLNNADLKFPKCLDEKGELHELTHGTYALHLKGKDRTLRKEAFVHLHETFGAYENTFCDLIQGIVEKHVFNKKARGYGSALEAALYPHQIDKSVYTSLIQAVRGKLSYLHEYMALRKEILGYKDLQAYDLSVSLVDDMDIKISYDEASKEIVESVALLGEEYQEIIRKGLLDDRWVDRYENKKKRSGAYSSGCYTSMPYILMNYHGTFQDAKTLAHEAGHSMHTYFSSKNQTYQDHGYPIFLAEVASTFHEELLFQHFYQKATGTAEKAYLINQKVEGIRSTLFRQVLFAEFELKIHEWVEEGVPLTPGLLQEYYVGLVRDYSGPSLEIDPSLAHEWSRIPHFYYDFYVYQYATGISAAHVLAKGVLAKEPLAKERMIEFLSSGGSKSPMETLQKAGVDMTTSSAVESMLDDFQGQVATLRELIKGK